MNASFGNQFRNYGSESVGLNVSVPIFNRMADTQQHPLGPDRHPQSGAGADRSPAGAWPGDRTVVLQCRGSLSEISVGLALAGGGLPGSLPLRGGEVRRRPLDDLRLQRCQNTHGAVGVGNWVQARSSNSSFAARFSTFTRANLSGLREILTGTLSRHRCRRNRNLIAYRKGYGLRRLFGKCGIDFDEDRTTTD